jgi:hypothetical protein
MAQIIREMRTPYTLAADDEVIGRETIVLQRDGKPVAVVVPYEEYTALLALKQPTPKTVDPNMERERLAYQRLLPELLRTHRGEWVAIVDEQAVAFGPTFQSVIVPVRKRYGQRQIYVQEVLETPRIRNIPSPHIVRQ